MKSPDFEKLKRLAVREVERVLKKMPPSLRQRAQDLPVICTEVPSDTWVADGVEPDTLGLFVGPEWMDATRTPAAPHILLFLYNIWDYAGEDEETFLEEIEATYVHEVGHYLGLNEDDLEERGLG